MHAVLNSTVWSFVCQSQLPRHNECVRAVLRVLLGFEGSKASQIPESIAETLVAAAASLGSQCMAPQKMSSVQQWEMALAVAGQPEQWYLKYLYLQHLALLSPQDTFQHYLL